ncbi:MAG: hypothetical protein QM627_05160 [Luteolibacter sp.]
MNSVGSWININEQRPPASTLLLVNVYHPTVHRLGSTEPELSYRTIASFFPTGSMELTERDMDERVLGGPDVEDWDTWEIEPFPNGMRRFTNPTDLWLLDQENYVDILQSNVTHWCLPLPPEQS